MTKKTASTKQAARRASRVRTAAAGAATAATASAATTATAGAATAATAGAATTAARGTATATSPATGDAIVALARRHIGEDYVLGARAPLAHPDWRGPWDCAEFASWCVYHATGILYGARPENDPVLADAYTGYWGEQAERDHATVPIESAVRIVGACLLRKPTSQRGGHIAISTGDGGTVEAHSTGRGVIAHTAQRRRWDYGVLVPGVVFYLGEDEVKLASPPRVLRLTRPLTRGAQVKRVQQRLADLGYAPGRPDGIYGPQTVAAVIRFQADEGLVADGEVGPATREALGLG